MSYCFYWTVDMLDRSCKKCGGTKTSWREKTADEDNNQTKEKLDWTYIAWRKSTEGSDGRKAYGKTRKRKTKNRYA